jgi:endo-1,3-1,4-beta-glycanase ExoK
MSTSRTKISEPRCSGAGATTKSDKTGSGEARHAAGLMGIPMRYRHLSFSLVGLLLTVAAKAGAVASAELYQNQTYTYGRFEARLRFAAGDGVVSSFFLWKPGSEMAGTYWNELDFEKLGADCHLQTNPLYGLPMADHHQIATLQADLCGEYHTYAFEWTPSYIAYTVDGVEVRRDTGDTAAAFAENATSGMQVHLNIWPGDASFGGNFDPAILPVQEYISWVQYSSFADGAFTFQWREDFDGATLPSGWALGNWASPKSLSTHQPSNVTFTAGSAVLSLTADDATGFTGAPPPDTAPDGALGTGGAGGMGGHMDAGGNSGMGGAGGAPPPAASAGAPGPGSTPIAGGIVNADGNTNAPAVGAAGIGATASAAGVSASSSLAQRPDSSASGCSQSLSTSARSKSAAWLAALIGVFAMLRRRR